ncbi:PAS domain-containing protein [Microcoleus sp. FACHB-68]|uniref:PAS domain-containing protein n=1 Tax=Microcoleus sp. FACHB-68 TaxID=2692826 RepID=UPI001687CFB2|nr:PAS domain-containing protein [Microcoleus sp. FACHB-68]MBD1935996.1 PAS domain-containing protein [Microcoleus sp. FACHB-68]
MQELLRNIFSEQFILDGRGWAILPQWGACDLWQPALVWLHILSHSLIAVVYYSISIMLVYFVRRRHDLPSHWVFWLLGAFILSCGTTHLTEVWALWHSHSWLTGSLKALTAVIALCTAGAMLPLIPQALALPSDLAALKGRLTLEICDRAVAEAHLRQTEAELQAIFKAVPDLYFRLYADGTILDYNAGHPEDLYLPPEMFLGKRMQDVLPAGVGHQMASAISQVFASPEETAAVPIQIEYSLPMPAGKQSYEARLIPLIDNQIIVIARNITTTKRSQEQVRSSQQMLRLVIDNIPELIYWKDKNSVYLGCNQNFARAAGVGTPEKIVGLTDFDLLWTEEEAGRFRESDRRVMETDTPEYHLIETHLQADGNQSWADTNKIPLHDAGGSVVGILGTYEDVTERTLAEEQLLRSEARFQRLAASVPGVIYQYRLSADGSQSILYVSPACRELYELEPEEFQQTFANHLIHPDDRPSLDRAMAVSASTLEPWHWEGRLITPSSERKWLQTAARPELQPNGDILWDALVIDITERKRVEEQVYFQALLLDAVEQAAIATDLDGKITYWNRFAETLQGWQKQEALGRNFIELLPVEASRTEAAELLSRLRAGTSWSGEFVLQRKDETTFPVMTTNSPIYDVNGVLIGTVSISQDITKRKQAEEALRQSEVRSRTLAQREKLLNRLASQIRNSLDLDTILGTAVHEIRNLLQIDQCLFIWYRPNSSELFMLNSELYEPIETSKLKIQNISHWEVVKEAKNSEMPSFLGCYSAKKTDILVNKQLLNLEMLRVDDMSKASEPWERYLRKHLGYTAFLALPIQTRSGDVGVVSCGHFSEHRPWSDNEVELLQAVSDQLAIAISQAESYAQAQEAARIAQAQAQQLEQALKALQQTQAQLIQSEKMSSLGQMVAGVAHEINNPVSFIQGNLNFAVEYIQKLLQIVQLYQQIYPKPAPVIEAVAIAIDLDFIIEDLPKMLSSMKIGAERIRQIVLSLRNFSRLDESQSKSVDIHEGLDSTLLLLQHRLKAQPEHPEIKLIKEYGPLPPVECYASQLNQVFMNILANAIDALFPARGNSQKLEAKSTIQDPQIRLRTEVLEEDRIAIIIADNGPGIPEEVRLRIFDPFYTTKPVGSGTGLGLSISYQIIVERHGGQLRCISSPGGGAEFIIEIPIRQPTPIVTVRR